LVLRRHCRRCVLHSGNDDATAATTTTQHRLRNGSDEDGATPTMYWQRRLNADNDDATHRLQKGNAYATATL
jgi:hypothetical protein